VWRSWQDNLLPVHIRALSLLHLTIVAYCPWHIYSKQWETSIQASIFLKRTPRHRHLPPAQPRANLDTSHWHPKAHSAVSRKVSTSLLSVISHANWTTSTDAPHGLQGSRPGVGEATQQLQDLTFVNMTDPQQSKSHESRKLVRRQVMVNFAREKRRQPKPSFPGGFQPGGNTSNTISGVQELLNAAMPTPGGATTTDWSPERSASGLGSPGRREVLDPDLPAQVAEAPTTSARSGPQRRKSTAQPSAARLLPSTVSSTSNSPGVGVTQWPVASHAQVQGLVNH
jgi:hypothetical protein